MLQHENCNYFLIVYTLIIVPKYF